MDGKNMKQIRSTVYYILMCIIGMSFTCQISAGEKYDNLRFIAGYPDPDYIKKDSKNKYESAILKMEGDSLIEESVLSDTAHILSYIRFYPDYGVLYAMSVERDSQNPTAQLHVVNTNSLDEKIYEIPFSLTENRKEYIIFSEISNVVLRDETLYPCFFCLNESFKETKKESGVVYYILNVETERFEKVNPSIYRGVLVNNDNIMFRCNPEWEDMKVDTIKNILRIPTPPYWGNPVYIDNLPLEVKLNPEYSKWGMSAPLINTKDVLMLNLYRISPLKWKINILDKRSGMWDDFILTSNQICFEYHNGYVVGHENISWDNCPYLPTKNKKYWTKKRTKYGPSYISERPIKEYLSDYTDEDWEIPDWPTDRMPCAEGDLFVYHVATKQKISWNTGHGDSEILLLQDENVYYRVYDKIYKAQIINHNKLGQSKLLIQSPIINDVHWMFITNGNK